MLYYYLYFIYLFILAWGLYLIMLQAYVCSALQLLLADSGDYVLSGIELG